MVGFRLIFSLAATLQVAVSTPVRARTAYAVKETHYVPRAWREVDEAPRSYVINLNIGIKQGSFEELDRHLYEGM